MKVNGNDPVMTTFPGDGGPQSRVPIRLELASRLLVGRMVSAIAGGHNAEESIIKQEVPSALRIADALIKAHNETCGGEG